MEAPKIQACNLTRRRYLSTDIVTGDFVHVIRKQWLVKLSAGSGMGLWMRPFRGIHQEDAQIPIDLIYLDEERRVIETVEGFPNSSISNIGHNVASVLALPFGSICSSQTRIGDQLGIGESAEMARRLKVFSHLGADADAIPTEAPSTTVHLASGLAARNSSDPTQLQNPSGGGKRRNWLQRFLDPPDSRRAARKPASGFTASFWTGGTPQIHEIRDISFSGMYVLTDERWYPETMVRITIARLDPLEPHGQRTITVIGKALRAGGDGVGFQFILRDAGNISRNTASFDTADRNALRRFLA